MRKQIKTVLMLASVVFMLSLAITAHAASSGTCGDSLTWVLDDEGTLTISGTGKMTSYSSTSGLPWYSSKSSIKKVVVEEGVTSLGNNAFSYCTNLTEVSLPDTLQTVGKSAFSSCSNLETLDIPDNVISISNHAFSYCDSLAQIELSDSLTSIGNDAFYSCDSLTEIVIPDGVTTLESYTFWGCSKLKTVTIPPSVKSAESSVFYPVTGSVIKGYTGSYAELIAVDYSKTFESIGELEYEILASGNLSDTIAWQYDNRRVLKISGTGEIPEYSVTYSSSDVPWADYQKYIFTLQVDEGITTLGKCVFAYLSRLSSVSLPSTLTAINDLAFNSCTTITEITIPDGVVSIGSSAFQSCNKLEYLTIPVSAVNISDDILYSSTKAVVKGYKYSMAEAFCIRTDRAFESLGELDYAILASGNLTDTITWKIDNYWTLSIDGTGDMPDFAAEEEIPWADYIDAVSYLEFSGNITSIGKNNFSGCSYIAEISLPETITDIGSGAFFGCSKLTSITLPEGVKAIGNSAFENCSTLTEFSIPESVETIGKNAFKACSAIVTISLPEGLTSLGEGAFYDCTSLFNITLPEGITVIEPNLFYNCKKLGYITIEGEVTSIGSEAFYYCAITSIDIPESVTSIGESAFKNCTKLTSASIPAGVMEISAEAFYGCTKLASVALSENLTKIGDQAFYNCNNLKSVTIPQGVEEIGDSAFYKIAGNNTLVIPSSVKKIGSSAFSYSNITGLVIENGVEIIGDDAFTYCRKLTGEVTIPESVTQIGASAFFYCNIMTSLTIESSCDIGDNAFANCTKLTVVNINGDIDTIGEAAFDNCSRVENFNITGSIKTVGKSAFDSCSSVTEITLTGVEYIEDYAFNYCSALEKVTIDSTIIEIVRSNSVFRNCSSAFTIYGYTNSAAHSHALSYNYPFVSIGEVEERVSISGQVNDTVMWGITTGGKLIISGNGPMEDYASTSQPWYNYRTLINKIVVEDGVTYIGQYAFYHLTNATEALIEGAEAIAYCAFADCTALKSVEFTHSLKTVGDRTFRGCSALTSVILPEGLETIEELAFYQCKALTAITLPEGLKTIGEDAFGYCSALTKVVIPASTYDIASDAFTSSGSVKIYGYTGSLVQAYAQQYSISFVSIGEMEEGVVLMTSTSNGIEYSLESHGVLTVKGKGEITGTWYAWSKFIKTVNVDMGITGITSAFMENITNAETLAIPYTTIYISSTFYNKLPDDITIIGFTGSKAEEVANKKSYKFLSVGKMPDVEVLQGTCGDLTWSLTTNGKLTVKGEGALIESFSNTVGATYGSLVKEIVIEEGVTCIENYALYWHFDNAQIIRTPSTIKTTGTHSVIPLNDELTVYCYEYSAVHDFLSRFSFDFEIVGTSPEWIKEEGTYGDGITWTYTNYGHLKILGEGAIAEGDIPWMETTKKLKTLTLGNITLFGEGSLPSLSNLETVYGYENSIAERLAEWKGVSFVATGALEEAEVVLSGQMTDTISYQLDSFGKLTITGTGDMPDYTSNGYMLPWANFEISPVEEIVISDGITRVGNYAFAYCYMADSVTFGADIESIGDYAFFNSGIREAKIPDKTTQIGAHGFGNCPELKTVWLSEGMTAIPDYAFNSCVNLTHIQIPVGITTIGKYAFTTSGLQYIYYGGTTPDWESRVSGKESIPEGVTVYYMKEIPEIASFEVTSVRKTSKGVEVKLEATLKGGESLYIAAYDKNGCMIGIRSTHKSGSYATTFDSAAKTIKVFVWADSNTLAPIEQPYTRTVV